MISPWDWGLEKGAFCYHLYQVFLVILTSTISEEQEMGDLRIAKEEGSLSLVLNNRIVCRESPEESTDS
jgi:hypothetical protein